MEKNFKVDFIGIGTAKSGTTWLFYCLGQHPQICLSEPKEINYFNHADFSKIFTKNQKLPLVNKNHTKPYLRNVFKDDIKELEKLLDRDLSHWK